MAKITIQRGDSARIQIILPPDKMADVEDVVCYVGASLVFKQSDNTLIATDTPNIFYIDLKSKVTNVLAGDNELAIAVDYSDLGVKKTPKSENLIIVVENNINVFSNPSVSDLILATVTVTINETTISATSCLASYVNIGGGIPEAPNDANAYVRSGLSWLIGYTKTAIDNLLGNKVDKVTGKSLIDDTEISRLASMTAIFTTALKTAYDESVTNITNLLATGTRLITSGEITKLSNTSGTNTGDETTDSIQSKRPLKTINNESLDGTGNIVIVAGKSFVKYKDTTPSALISGTTEQVLIVIPIASIGFTIGSWFILKNRLERPIKGGNNCILKYYTHNSASWSIGEGTQIAAFNASSNQGYIPFKREFSVQSDNTLFGYQSNITIISDDGLTAGLSSTPFSGKTHIIVTVTQSNLTDTIRSREVIIMGEV